MKVISLWKQSVRKLQVETYAIYLAHRHPRTPWDAKLLAAIVIAYAVSPIDLIPDFIPVIGLLDDLILVPLGTALVLKMIPRDVLAECRQKAVATMELDKGTKARWLAAGVIIAIWCLVLALATILVFRIFT